MYLSLCRRYCRATKIYSIMVYDSNFGKVDCTHRKCRVNGEVLHKYELIEFMRRLDFAKFYWRLLYAYDVMSYSEIYGLLEDYLSGDLED